MNNRPAHSSLIRRPVFITGLVAALAAGIGTGCSTTDTKYGWHTNAKTYQNDRLAAMSTAQVDPEAIRGQYDAQWYKARAAEAQLPAVWVSEAARSVHEMESRRAAIEAHRINSQAEWSERLAYADAEMKRAGVREAMSIADADYMRNSFDAKLQEMDVLAMAQERAIEDEAIYGDSMRNATVQERQAQFERLRSEATADFDRSQAQHQRMLAERTSVADIGWASIGEMTKIAEMTESRAASKARALRVSGDTIREQTQARIAELSEQIASTRQQTSTEIASLRERASTLRSQAFADADELIARAEQIESADHSARYDLAINNAEQSFLKAQADAESQRAHAEVMLNEVEAELTRRVSDAQRFLSVAEADFTNRSQQIETQYQSATAEFEMLQKFAESLEREARGQFVAAEAEAIAGARFEKAAHMSDLAQKQFEAAKAQATAEATQLKAQISRQIAQRLESGAVSLPSTINSDNPMAGFEDFRFETVTTDAEAPSVFEPEHIAQFKTTLAKSALVAAKAEALRTAADASYEESLQKLEAWWTQKQAMHDRFIAEANAMEQKAIAKSEEMIAKSENMLRVGEAQRSRALAEAEAIRKDAFADAAACRAKAKSIREKAKAASTQMLAEANALEESGQAQVKSLRASLESEKVRGEAKARELIADADAVEQGQRAVVAQMRQEIKSAEQVLRAELARLDQGAESFLQIAEATYQEAVTIADTFDTKTQILATRMQADSEADFRISMADVEHLRNMTAANELAAQASVERAIAQADLERSEAVFNDSVRRSRIDAGAQIASAQMDSARAKADAMDDAAASLFQARIAGVAADRDRAFARAYLNDQSASARRNQAIAAANAYREISEAAVARLNTTKFQFEQAASENWDARLAIPGALTAEDLDGSQWLLKNASFTDLDIAGVPTFED